MAEKQPTAYVVCRWKQDAGDGYPGDNIPVKVFDTRREAREYASRMNKRSRHYGYNVWPVKQG